VIEGSQPVESSDVSRTRRGGRWRRSAWLAIGLALVLLGGYVAGALVVYDQLTAIGESCLDRSDPTSFTVEGVDTDAHHLPPAVEARFPSRDDGDVTIAASWFPAAASPDVPTVILVHGLGGCRHGARDLLAAGMLYRHGIAVLMVDLRDHGDSSREDGRFAGGTDEYRDVLGGWDWLRSQGVPESRIGLLGFSLGAATTMIAMGREPRVAAIWADSAYGDIREAIRDELDRNGYPTILAPGGVLAARVLSGDDLDSHSPLETTTLLDGRPIALTHGLLDERIDVRYAYQLAASVAAHGQVAELWVVPDAHHTEALILHPAEYEQRLAEFFLRVLGS